MRNRITIAALILFFAFTFMSHNGAAQEVDKESGGLGAQYEKIQENLEQSLGELSKVQEEIASEKLPISRALSRQEEVLSAARTEFAKLTARLDSRNMDLNNLRAKIETLEQQKTYISSLLGEYVRSLETQLHIAEVQAYEDQISAAKLALTNDTLTTGELFEKQLESVEVSLDRLEKLNGGMRFKGQAVGEGGVLEEGEFVLVGPVAFFSAGDGATAGYVVEMLGSTKPNVISFGSGENTDAFIKMTRSSVDTGVGELPIDATLGNAQKIAETKDTLWEHIRKGGIVMIPILGLAGLALIIAVVKWIQLARVKMPSAKSLSDLLGDIRDRTVSEAKMKARGFTGPAGEMLQIAVDHLHQSKELVEEVMYEKILETRTRLNKALPFIAVCASSAPLLGLLGTVTGIINTFKLISAFGSGDAKTLSGGISEALVTTEFGLIVAIPSLLLHAFLNRRAKSQIDHMEKIAVGVMNQINQSDGCESGPTNRDVPDSTREHEKEVFHG